jgi:hypothetical protein
MLFFGEIRWVIKSKKPVNAVFHELSNIFNTLKSGGEGNRTPVQTYSTKAFYMLSSLLIVGDGQEMNEPIHHLAVWSFAAVTAFCSSILFFLLVGGGTW